MGNYCAVLLDTVSIQKYVFASNMLRDNLGASHIVNKLFDDMAIVSLAEVYRLEKEKIIEIAHYWKKDPGKMLMDNEPSNPFEFGVAGGGKALIFFRDLEQAKLFIETFTRYLLIQAPGIQLAVAIEENFIPDNNFSNCLTSLYNQLAQNRNRYFPVTTLQNHGITAIYSETGTSLNRFFKKEGYIPIEKATKLEAAYKEEKIRQEEMENRYPSLCFSNRVDWLGQIEGNNNIAVVHIDGNNMGNWFKKSNNLKDYRQRSINLDRITKESFWSLVDDVTNIIEQLIPQNGFNMKKDKYGKKYLPLRPLILGGDDITFICEGRLGLYLAERFLQIWTKKANSQLSKYGMPDNGEFSACAGVAIANTKYPFYRTYSFAEELCASAKKSAREAQKSSWIDFHIISGTKSGDLEAIRKDEGVSWDMHLHFGPYCLEANQNKSLQNLKEGILSFQQSWIRSDIKELRTAFYSGIEVLDTYLIDMFAKGGRLPHSDTKKYGVDYSHKGCVDMRTPYFDMLEMMEYYPQFLLEGGIWKC